MTNTARNNEVKTNYVIQSASWNLFP